MGVEVLWEAFQLPFMARSLATVLVLAVASGVIGVFVNLRGLEFVSDGLVHAVFPGLVIGFAVASTGGLIWGAFAAALIGAVLLTVAERRGLGSDATIAVVLTSMFGIGIVIVSRQQGYVAQLEQLLFGRLLTVTDAQLTQIAVLSALAVLLIAATGKEQLFRAFDRHGARAAGRGGFGVELILNVAVALVVVAGAQAIGSLLVLALLIVPAAIGRLITRRFAVLFPIAVISAALAGWAGLVIGFTASVGAGLTPSPGATVVLVLVALYVVVLLGSLAATRMRRATVR